MGHDAIAGGPKLHGAVAFDDVVREVEFELHGFMDSADYFVGGKTKNPLQAEPDCHDNDWNAHPEPREKYEVNREIDFMT